ncbi:MAG: methyltransferase domain-containing protein [Candidatus Hydrogenedentes bacterium]|nr:methyltransferase domain-containing protein [Candidatus Hydrogenedentota bacterium]
MSDPERADRAIPPRRAPLARRPAAPILHTLLEAHRISHKVRILCYGCGQGADVQWFLLRRFKVHGYDPHPPFGYSDKPEGHYEFVFFNYLMTRLKTPEARRRTLAEAFQHVKPGGALVVTSRILAQVWAAGGDEGVRSHARDLLADCDTAEMEVFPPDAGDQSIAVLVRRSGVYRPASPWVWVDAREDFEALCPLLERERIMGLDVETTLEEPRTLCTVQIAVPGRTYVLDALKLAPLDPLRPVMENPDVLKIIHNADFEREMLARHAIKLDGVYDTLAASRKKHRKGGVSGHKLGDVCERELGIYLDKALQLSDWTVRPLSPDQLNYAAVDAEVMLLLHRVFEPPLPQNLELF